MPTINKNKLCQKHGFYNAIQNDRCPDCKRSSDKTYDKTIRKSERVKIYNSKRWKQVRELALIRDNMMCQVCKEQGKDVLADEVHHIIELSEDITKAYDLDNLQSICHSCHMQHHI
jgi:5-methylcytosine-specific restriction protein A